MPNDHRGRGIAGNFNIKEQVARHLLRRAISQAPSPTHYGYGYDFDERVFNHPDFQAVSRFMGDKAAYPMLLDEGDKASKKKKTKQIKSNQRARRREEISEAVTSKVAPYRATAYDVSREYGGPEEGGWWYDVASPVEDSRPFLTERGARKAAQRMKSDYPTTGSRSSVRGMSAHSAYSADYDAGEASDSDWNDYQNTFGNREADYTVRVQRGRGRQEPRTRPHYE